MFLTYKYRLKSKRSARLLRVHARAVNQVWNYCVETQRKVQRNWRDGAAVRWPSRYDMQGLTAGTSHELGIQGQTIQDICWRFVRSRDRNRKCPRFRRSSGARRSLGWVPFQRQSRQLGGNFVRYRGHDYRYFGAKRRPLPDVVKGGCFVEDARGRWWVCLIIEVTDDQQHGDGEVGIDLGLRTLATLSDGRKIEAPRTYRLWEDKLIVAERARRTNRVRSIHDKIACIRRDHHHKRSTQIVRQYGAIYVGDVNAPHLRRTNLVKSAMDAGWSTFRDMLRYKASRHGAQYAEVDEKLTTQTCSSCGALPPERPKGIAGLGIREWECSSCGAIHDRDVNAARNILALGRSVTPPVEGSRRKRRIGTNRQERSESEETEPV